MRSLTKTLKSEVSAWPHVTVAPHQFAAREFRFRNAEIGHVHLWGDVDIPFPPAVHDVLLAEGRAQRHRWLPDSGWVTYRIHNHSDLAHALWLLRLSYMRYALKNVSDPEKMLQDETERLKLLPPLASLMAKFVRRRAEAQKNATNAA